MCRISVHSTKTDPKETPSLSFTRISNIRTISVFSISSTVARYDDSRFSSGSALYRHRSPEAIKNNQYIGTTGIHWSPERYGKIHGIRVITKCVGYHGLYILRSDFISFTSWQALVERCCAKGSFLLRVYELRSLGLHVEEV